MSSSRQPDNAGIEISRDTQHILIADDDADDRLFFKEAIEEVNKDNT